MPNRAPARTNRRVGSHGGSVPRRVEAMTDRAVRGLRSSDICRDRCNMSAWRPPRMRPTRCSRRPTACPTCAHRALDRQRQAGARPAHRPAPHRRSPQRGQRPADVGSGRRHHRRGGVARQPAGLGGRVPADGAGARTVRHHRPRVRPQAALHQQALERPGRPVAALVPGVRAVRCLPALALRPPPRRVRPRRARPQPLRRLPDHPQLLRPQAAPRRRWRQWMEEPPRPPPGPAQARRRDLSRCASWPASCWCSSP